MTLLIENQAKLTRKSCFFSNNVCGNVDDAIKDIVSEIVEHVLLQLETASC